MISGFLITGIIARGRDEGRFSYVGFYLRRARRIVPAYLVVLAAIAGLSLWLLLPLRLVWTGRALAAAGPVLTNLGFTISFGYFTPAVQQNPLLHLWSLGVEEQFYLVWPLLLAWPVPGGRCAGEARRSPSALLAGLAGGRAVADHP